VAYLSIGLDALLALVLEVLILRRVGRGGGQEREAKLGAYTPAAGGCASEKDDPFLYPSSSPQ
jgi:hypothetical protein